MWKYGARLDWTTVIVDTRDANAHSPMPCKFQWFDDCAIATMFFFSKIVFNFRVSSVLFSLEFSWLPSQKHIASQRIIDVWAKYNGKGVDRLVISCFIDNSSYIAMMYVCISMAALCSDDAQTIINNQRNFAFSLVKFRNHLSIQHHMKNTYWHCYFHFVLRQLAGFNGVKKQMKLK